MSEHQQSTGAGPHIPSEREKKGDSGNGRYREQSTSTLALSAIRKTMHLVNSELSLARTEVTSKVNQAENAVASLVTGAVVTLSGFIVLLFAAVWALALVWELWLSALVVGGVVTIIGAILLAAGRSKLRPKELKPEQTIESFKQDRDMAEEHWR